MNILKGNSYVKKELNCWIWIEKYFNKKFVECLNIRVGFNGL